ncbi:MAG: DUF1289 domain-containing protein [Hyphomicrobiaceae bacterium]
MTTDSSSATAASSRPALPPSPCVGICALKDDHCYGCGRTSDEIAAWGTLSADAQSAVWAELPGRLAAFGYKTFRLAAGPAVVGDFIARSLREATGRWRLVSASIEGVLPVTASGRPTITEAGDHVVATAASGDTLTLVKHDRVRIFGFAAGDTAKQMDTVALVLPKGRAQRDLDDAANDAAPDARTALPLAEPFARAWRGNGSHDARFNDPSWIGDAATRAQLSADGAPHISLHNALGTITTSGITFNPDAPADANAPADVKISRAFIAGAIFHADDPAWLAAALAP